jgi:hypothetical protein
MRLDHLHRLEFLPRCAVSRESIRVDSICWSGFSPVVWRSESTFSWTRFAGQTPVPLHCAREPILLDSICRSELLPLCAAPRESILIDYICWPGVFTLPLATRSLVMSRGRLDIYISSSFCIYIKYHHIYICMPSYIYITIILA